MFYWILYPQTALFHTRLICAELRYIGTKMGLMDGSNKISWGNSGLGRGEEYLGMSQVMLVGYTPATQSDSVLFLKSWYFSPAGDVSLITWWQWLTYWEDCTENGEATPGYAGVYGSRVSSSSAVDRVFILLVWCVYTYSRGSIGTGILVWYGGTVSHLKYNLLVGEWWLSRKFWNFRSQISVFGWFTGYLGQKVIRSIP